MIYGIGTDICDVRRIRASLERHGERFAARVLSDTELATWRSRSARWPERGVRFLATRFSAKEAFSKAIGLGMVMPMTLRSCQPAQRPADHRAAQRAERMVRGARAQRAPEPHRRDRLRRQFLCCRENRPLALSQ